MTTEETFNRKCSISYCTTPPSMIIDKINSIHDNDNKLLFINEYLYTLKRNIINMYKELLNTQYNINDFSIITKIISAIDDYNINNFTICMYTDYYKNIILKIYNNEDINNLKNLINTLKKMKKKIDKVEYSPLLPEALQVFSDCSSPAVLSPISI